MALKNRWRLFALGAVCLMCAVGSAYIKMQVGWTETFALLAGTMAIVTCLWLLRDKRRSGRRPWIYIYGPWIAVIFLISSVIAGINYLAYRCPWRWDLTQTQQHTLTDYTHQVLAQLQDDVNITAFFAGLPARYLEDMFQEYERNSNRRVKTDILDPLVDIGQAAQFGNIISSKENKVIVQSASGRKDVDFTDSPLTEEQLTNALLQVTRTERHAYFLTGHGEYRINSEEDKGLKVFTQLLEKNNIQSHDLILTSGGIPDDCDILIVAGPQEPLSEGEEAAIEDYLKAGGDALFLIEHTVITTPDKALREEELNRNPSLNAILTQWGVRIANDIVVDLASHASGDVGSPATRNYPEHDAIVQGLDYTFYIRPRSISVLGNRRETVRVAPLVMTASPRESWGETNRNLTVKYDDILDRPGPVPIAFVIMEPKEDNEQSDTRIAVYTDADFLSNAFIKQYSNAQMGLSVVNWLSELDYHVFLDRQIITVGRLDLTSQEKRVVVVILFALPFFIVSAGVMVWLQGKEV